MLKRVQHDVKWRPTIHQKTRPQWVESGRSNFRHSREGGNPAKQPITQPDVLPIVYILASLRNGTLSVGVTSDLPGRIYQHRHGLSPGFTREYGVKLLVRFEQHPTMESAIIREKRIKKWNRAWKLELIEASNPDWHDLAEDFGFQPLMQAAGD